MKSKVVVITGASAGIGAALAIQLGAGGHNLALAGRRESELKRVATLSGNHVITVVCDVTKRSDMENLKKSTLEKFGSIDVWINNAGRGIGKTVMELSDNDFDEMIDVNLRSAFYGMQAIVPYFKEQKKGHIINVSSMLGKVPYVTFRSIYSAAKAALNSLTANLRMDLAPDYPDIDVSVVMPGPVLTEFSKNALGGTPKFTGKGVAKPQTAEDVAAVMVDLIKDPKPEVFTNPALHDTVRRYYDDVGAFEESLRQG